LVPWLLASALAAMPSAMCVLGAAVTQPRPACVTAMDGSGGTLQEGCCASERSDLVSLASSTPADQFAWSAPSVVSLPTSEPTAPVRLAWPLEEDPTASSGRPAYLLASAFRI
jgi:hypothetical protein